MQVDGSLTHPTTQEMPTEILHLGQVPFADRAAMAYRGHCLHPPALHQRQESIAWFHAEQIPSSDAAISMLKNTAQTLTSLNLDWLYCAPRRLAPKDMMALDSWPAIYQQLFSCRFPHLRSFQWRNCVVPETQMPQGLYLLDHSRMTGPDYSSYPWPGRRLEQSLDLAGLEFMEAHPGLQCLAWPMDHFFAHTSPSADIATRVEAVVDNLGRTLTDLRVDTAYSGTGESNSEAVYCTNTGEWCLTNA